MLGNPEEACKMARQAFEDAIAELDSVSEDSYKVCLKYMYQLPIPQISYGSISARSKPNSAARCSVCRIF